MLIQPNPYKLINYIQHYAWGTSGGGAYIPELLNITPEKDVKYAELWIGAHPKLTSSIIEGTKKIPLDKFIEENPEKILGKRVSTKFGNKLPFLLKVLSIGKTLSIQAHPGKRAAVQLNQKFPERYPDPNHKPEIAIAIDQLTAVAGFRPHNEITDLFNNFPELGKFISPDLLNALKSPVRVDGSQVIKKIYSDIMNSDEETLVPVINSLREKFSNSLDKSTIEKTFLSEFETYGYDPGLITLLLFNKITLDKGEGLNISAGIPHAYISGNIIECMANSDNVVRGGLTPKFKDIHVLLEILDTRGGKPEILSPGELGEYTYKSPVEEYQLTRYKNEIYMEHVFAGNDTIKIGIVINGSVSISDDENRFRYNKGESFLIPAIFENFNISAEGNTEFYLVTVP